MQEHGGGWRTRCVGWLFFSLLGLGATSVAAAQQEATLTLAEALKLAHQNNPDYLAQANDIGPADWAVREAYGNLLPGASASTSFQYQGAGTQRFGVFTGGDLGISESPSYYLSSYDLGLSYQLNGANLLGPSREKANRRATEANIRAASVSLDRDVTFQYLAILRAQDAVTLSDQELAQAAENLKLAQARVAVGSAIPMEATQAEVARGRAEVALLQARNLVASERLKLIQILGVDIDRSIRLTTSFKVTDVPWSLDNLMARARSTHPQLLAARAAERASTSALRMAKAAYLPSLQLDAGFSGYTREAGNAEYLVDQARQQQAGQAQSCQLLNNISAGLSTPLPGTPADCSDYTVTAADAALIRSTNNVFPFHFSKQPFTLSMRVSLPIFQGFSRERQVEQARVALTDAGYRTRAEELRIRTEVETAYQNVVTAKQSVDLEARNRALAEDQLRLARERYRVGSATFLELQDAETALARAARSYLIAVYTFHEGVATLETAVGMPLRQLEASN